MMPLGVMIMKKLEDGWYIVTKAYKLRDFLNIVCPCYPYVESTDSMIPVFVHYESFVYKGNI